MKKTYIKPVMEIMELDIETLMISMSAPGGNGNEGPSWGGDSEGGMEADANDRRGEWGNLWKK